MIGWREETEIHASGDTLWAWERSLFGGHACSKEMTKKAKHEEEERKERGGPHPKMSSSSGPKVLSLAEQEGLGFTVVAATPPNQQ